MANEPFYIKQHATAPSWVYDVQDDVDTPTPTPVDLTSATSVQFRMRIAQTSGTPKVSGAMTITDAVSGRVTYDWQIGDTDEVGTYDVEHAVTWSDGTVEVFPNDSYETIIIPDDLSD